MFRKTLAPLRNLITQTKPTPTLHISLYHSRGDLDDWRALPHTVIKKEQPKVSISQLSMKDFMDKTQGKVTEKNNRMLCRLFKQARVKNDSGSVSSVEHIAKPK